MAPCARVDVSRSCVLKYPTFYPDEPALKMRAVIDVCSHIQVLPSRKTRSWKNSAGRLREREMQISGAAGGEWHSSMFDGIHSFLVALRRAKDSTEG